MKPPPVQILASETFRESETAANTMLKELGSGALDLLRKASKISSRHAVAASFQVVDTAQAGSRWAFQDVAPGSRADCR